MPQQVASTEFITSFDAYIEKLRIIYPPPHPAVQIAKEAQAILEQRVIDLEDAITQAGLILSGPEDIPEVARHVIKRAMKSLGSVMNDPKIIKRQGI